MNYKKQGTGARSGVFPMCPGFRKRAEFIGSEVYYFTTHSIASRWCTCGRS